MNWKSIVSAFRGRTFGLNGAGASGKTACGRSTYLHEHCRVSNDEANRRKRDWMRDPGVLDDWNDTRSILDM